MSLFGAIASGITGLDSNAQSLASISANIANLNTVGYKRNESRFQTLVSPGQGGVNEPSGVIPKVRNLIDQQGLMQTSSNSTHLGITGNGLFVVSDRQNATNTVGEFLFTRAGQFEADKNGNLVNTSGMFLRGWAIDPVLGTITGDRGSLTATEAVNIEDIGGAATKTSNVTLKMNLNSEETITSAPTNVTAFAAVAGQTITGDTLLSNAAIITGGTLLANNDSIDLQVVNGLGDDTTALRFTFVTGTPVVASRQFNTLNQLASLINSQDGMSASVTGGVLTLTGDPRSTIVRSGAVATGTRILGANATVAATYNPAASATNMASNNITPSFERSMQVFDTKGGAHTLTFAYLKSNFANTYYVEVHIEPAAHTNPANHLDGIIASGRIKFNIDGTVNLTATDVALRGSADGGNDLVINWGPQFGVETPQTIAVNLGTSGKADGVTQFASASALSDFTVDGAIFGQLSSVSVSEAGVITALFDNGTSRDLYKLPVATFTNTNGLDPRGKNTFQQTTASGDFNLKEAGISGAGDISPASFESSTVDLADEFTEMILTQQAFSASGKVVSVGTELLDEVIRLVR